MTCGDANDGLCCSPTKGDDALRGSDIRGQTAGQFLAFQLSVKVAHRLFLEHKWFTSYLTGPRERSGCAG